MLTKRPDALSIITYSYYNPSKPLELSTIAPSTVRPPSSPTLRLGGNSSTSASSFYLVDALSSSGIGFIEAIE